MQNDLIVDEYKNIGLSTVDGMYYAISFRPTPQESDYANGYITRYYVEKINSSIVSEVSPENYNQVSQQVYIKSILQWKITGIRKNRYNGRTIEEIGVEDYNHAQVENLSKTLPHLKNFVKNYLEFWRGK